MNSKLMNPDSNSSLLEGYMDLHKQGRCWFSRMEGSGFLVLFVFIGKTQQLQRYLKRGGDLKRGKENAHAYTHPSNTKFNETQIAYAKWSGKSILTYLVKAHPGKRFPNVCP